MSQNDEALSWPEAQRVVDELTQPVRLRCSCGEEYHVAKTDSRQMEIPFAQPSLDQEWECAGCYHRIKSGPNWGVKS